MNKEERKVTISISEIGSFIAYAAIVAVLAVGLYAVAPKGLAR